MERFESFILIDEAKAMRIFYCGQLWILYFKINFKILYLTQFSIFLERS
jgi:hypothetical protein